MRLFFALDLPEKHKQLLAKSLQQLKPYLKKASCVSTENYHITLHFLGETAFSDVLFLQNLADGLSSFPCVQLSNNQIAFWRAANVLCAKYCESRELSDIYAYLQTGLKQGGFFVEEHRFIPHVTLARKPVFSIPYVEALKNTCAYNMPFVCDSVTLYSSELTDQGSVYTPLRTVKLKEN